MPTYEPAKAAVTRRCDKVMKAFHPELHELGVTLDVLMVGPTTNENGDAQGPPLKRNGYPCAAIIKVTSLRDRSLGRADALLQLDEDRWKDFSEAQQDALIDHELEHLFIAKDQDGHHKVDDLGRPRLRIKAHDREVGWFDAVARRHQKEAIEWAAFNQVWESCRQLDFDFMGATG